MTRASVSEIIQSRGIERLCHFTPFRNAHRIIPSRRILCSAGVKKHHPESYNPTDEKRIDQRETHVCTTIEYPNVWYLDKVEARDDVWIDYLVFHIKADVMTRPHVEFCTNNAARGRGAYCKPGATALEALYAPEVKGYATYARLKGHPSWLPTDMQAEVLVPDTIPFEDVTGLVVRSKTIAKRLLAQLRAAQMSLELPVFVSPGTFDQAALRKLRTGGPRPREEQYA